MAERRFCLHVHSMVMLCSALWSQQQQQWRRRDALHQSRRPTRLCWLVWSLPGQETGAGPGAGRASLRQPFAAAVASLEPASCDLQWHSDCSDRRAPCRRPGCLHSQPGRRRGTFRVHVAPSPACHAGPAALRTWMLVASLPERSVSHAPSRGIAHADFASARSSVRRAAGCSAQGNRDSAGRAPASRPGCPVRPAGTA